MISWLCVGFFTDAAMTNDQREVLTPGSAFPARDARLPVTGPTIACPPLCTGAFYEGRGGSFAEIA